MTIWMQVTMDELELPLAIADTQRELARKLGIDPNRIALAISHAKLRGYRSQYRKVVIEEDENDKY